MDVWDYIILGEIPGTDVQVSFVAWLIISISLVLLALFVVAAHYNYKRTAGANPQGLVDFTAIRIHDAVDTVRIMLAGSQQLRIITRRAAFLFWLASRPRRSQHSA